MKMARSNSRHSGKLLRLEKGFFYSFNGPLHVDDDEALSQAVLGGLGMGLLPTFIIGKDLQSGKLQAVLSEYIPVERHVYAMYLPTRHLPNKVRVFIDFLVKLIGEEPYWDRSVA